MFTNGRYILGSDLFPVTDTNLDKVGRVLGFTIIASTSKLNYTS